MHHIRLQDLIQHVDDLELLKQYDRLFAPGPSHPTMPLPKTQRRVLAETEPWTHKLADREPEEQVQGEPERQKKTSKKAPLVPQTPSEISKSILVRCDPCKRRRTTCTTPNGSKRCLCCAKKGTQCTYGKQAESKERGKGRRFGLRR